MVFARHIVPASGGADPDGAAATYKSEFRVDDRAVTWEVYAQRLGGLGILVKVRNFLVFQVRACGRVRVKIPSGRRGCS